MKSKKINECKKKLGSHEVSEIREFCLKFKSYKHDIPYIFTKAKESLGIKVDLKFVWEEFDRLGLRARPGARINQECEYMFDQIIKTRQNGTGSPFWAPQVLGAELEDFVHSHGLHFWEGQMSWELPEGKGNKWITVKEAAKLLGRTEGAIRNLCYRGKLDCRKYLGRVYINQQAILRSIEGSTL